MALSRFSAPPRRAVYRQPVPRADLTPYNQQRRAGYKPPPDYNAQLVDYMASLREPEFSGHKEAQPPVGARTYGLPQPKVDKYGRPLKQVDPALMAKVMNSPPGTRVAFNESIPRAGEDFFKYMMDEGVVPHFGAPSSVTNVHSGRWTDYLLNRMGVYSYGVNPYASPYPPQKAPAPAAGGGGGGGGGGYTPEEPKQYGNIRNTQGRNLDQWLLDLVSWTI